MKKLSLLFIIILLTTSCSETVITETEDINNIYVESIVESPEIKNAQEENTWQKSYISFLNEDIPEETNIIYDFALRDLDNCGIPELIIFRRYSNTDLNAILTVYKYEENNVVKLSDYTNKKSSFVGGFFVSPNTEFPGLFSNWWGGGIEQFEYLSVINGKFIYEDVLIIDRTGDEPEYIELSENKLLINEVYELYEKEPYGTDLLMFYAINNEMEEVIQKYSPEKTQELLEK